MWVEVSLKAARDYDAPWIVLKGQPDEVLDELRKLTGAAEEVASQMDMSTATVEAASMLRNKEAVKRTLGGTFQGETPQGPPRKTSGSEDRSTPKAAAPAKSAEVTVELVVNEVKLATSRAELREIWSERNAALSEADKATVKAALKARTEELSK